MARLRFSRAAPATAFGTKARAFVPSYWMDRLNSCPACSRSNWWVGRMSAECGFCGTTLPIAAANGALPVQKAA